MRFVGQAYHFRALDRIVLASAARIGLAHALSGQELIPSERFYAGGGRTVRGAREDDLGPRDFLGPTGGGAVLVLNQEARFPIYRWLRGVGFLDLGNVFASPSAFDLTALEGSIGFGFRLDTPFALLRLDYGRRLSPRSDEPRGRWIFGIGHIF
jgi:outer membrane protein assembly factor BamA